MTNIISTISGYFSKSLILGTFLPVVVFVLLSLIFMVPLLPVDLPFLKPLEALDTQWKVLAISFLTVVLTGLLYNLNVPIIRLYEGYPWKDWWVGKRRRTHYTSQRRAVEAQWLGMPALQNELEKIKREKKLQTDERIAQLQERLVEAGRRLQTEFPNSEKHVLPTKLGNVIRSFETYPQTQYGIEAITLWPRLVAEINKDYAAIIDDAKTSFDFMLNCSVLSAILSLAILFIGLIYPTPLASPQLWPFWLLKIIIFGALAYFLYFLSIGRAGSWGQMVKGAFDLYRWDLLKRLGYTRLPTTQAEEDAMWTNISNRMIFGEYRLTPPAEYAPATPFARGQHNGIRLEVGRGIDPPGSNGEVAITLNIRNVGKYPATRVVVTDALPDGFQYKWGSATVIDPHASGQTPPARRPTVVGANPYRFTVEGLDIKRELTLIYRALPFSKKG